MTRKTVFVDTSKCTGCKACTVACKEWNELPAEQTRLVRSYQTQRDFTPATWTYVSFGETYKDGRMLWNMRKAQCFHCGDPACLRACTSGAIRQTETGYVVIDQAKCIGCGYCVENCPFQVPKLNPVTAKAYKCTGCIDRVENNLTPACVQTCQTGALAFGDREMMLNQAKQRLAIVQKNSPNAILYGEKELNGLTYVYLLTDRPEVYELPVNPTVPLSLILWKDVVRPVGTVAMGAAAVAVIGVTLSNILRGAYKPTDHHEGQESQLSNDGKPSEKLKTPEEQGKGGKH